MTADDPIHTRLLRIVSLIKEGNTPEASREIDVLDRDLFGPQIGGRGQLFDFDRSVSVTDLLDCASESLAAGDSQGALISLDQALRAWARVSRG
jgi:hypothetical protein